MSVDPLDRDEEVENDQTLFRELAWSAALVGGVFAYLLLVAQIFA